MDDGVAVLECCKVIEGQSSNAKERISRNVGSRLEICICRRAAGWMSIDMNVVLLLKTRASDNFLHEK